MRTPKNRLQDLEQTLHHAQQRSELGQSPQHLPELPTPRKPAAQAMAFDANESIELRLSGQSSFNSNASAVAMAFDANEPIELRYNHETNGYEAGTTPYANAHSVQSDLELGAAAFEVESFDTPQPSPAVQPEVVTERSQPVPTKSAAPPPQPATPSEPTQDVASADEFLEDLQAILNGEKTYDGDALRSASHQPEQVADSSPQSNQLSTAEPSPPTPEPSLPSPVDSEQQTSPHDVFDRMAQGIPPEPTPPEPPPTYSNGHSVFDLMGKSMAFANSFDLGTISLQQRFDEFDRLLDAEEKKDYSQRFDGEEKQSLAEKQRLTKTAAYMSAQEPSKWAGAFSWETIKANEEDSEVLKTAIKYFETNRETTSKDYGFQEIDTLISQKYPAKSPEIYIMEGDYPDEIERKKPINRLAKELGEKLKSERTITVCRILERSKRSDHPHNDEVHGITVGSLVYFNYPQALISLYVSFGMAEHDFKEEYERADTDGKEILSIKTIDRSFSTFFQKLLDSNVQDSVINLSQMVQPKACLNDKTVEKMINLAKKNNVIVLAMGNQTAKCDNTPAFKNIHTAIKKIDDEEISGAIVLVENLLKFGKEGAALVGSSNYILDSGLKQTTLAVKGACPEIHTTSYSVGLGGTGTSYAAPKLSALISKLRTAALLELGSEQEEKISLKGRHIVKALIETAGKYEVRKTSAFDDNGEKLEKAVEDTFTIYIPSGQKALNYLKEMPNPR